MRKNVALLTLPLSDNYGGMLQIIALYALIEELGHQPLYIHKVENRTVLKKCAASILENIPGQDFRGIRVRALGRKRHYSELAARMPVRTRQVKSGAEISEEMRRLSVQAVVVGSDQVWRREYQGDRGDLNYFLDFNLGSARRISFAASFGRSEWSESGDTSRISAALRRFHSVSVRERSGVEICRSTFGLNNAECVLDPTLAVDPKFYDSFDHNSGPKGGVVTYVLDYAGEVAKIARFAAERASLPVKRVTTYPDKSLSQWVATFRDADFVVTDSYHGVLFSIIFSKPFLVVPNGDRGLDRFTSLLGQLGLEDRMVRGGADWRAKISSPIDYSLIGLKLEPLREQSREFLRNALANDDLETVRAGI